MEFTSASANKYLRRLQDEKDRLLRSEQEVSTYVLAEGEAAEPPAYDYGAVREKVAQIDAEARRLIDEAYRMAEQVLRDHADGLKELAERLLEKEVVFTEDVERIFGKRRKDILKERQEAEKAQDAEPIAEPVD